MKLPRLQNSEADALTNSECRHFNMSNDINVDLATLLFPKPSSLFAEGVAYVKELEVLRTQEAGGGRRSSVA